MTSNLRNSPAQRKQKTRDLLRLDELLRTAAAATKRSASNRKWYASALGVSLSRTSRHMSGDPHSPAARVLTTLDRLARGEGTSAWPLVAEGIATVIQAEISRAARADLESRLATLVDAGYGLQADVNREMLGAESRLVENLLERIAIRRELANPNRGDR